MTVGIFNSIVKYFLSGGGFFDPLGKDSLFLYFIILNTYIHIILDIKNYKRKKVCNTNPIM